jgi:hypothetical protein
MEKIEDYVSSQTYEKMQNLKGNVLANFAQSELEHWIKLNYPRATPRTLLVMARAWLPLLMRHEKNFQTSNIWNGSILPSAWNEGEVMQANWVSPVDH